jgi:membrane fusion protein (multidrug efflux system)
MKLLRAAITLVVLLAILGGVAVILLKPQWIRPAAEEEAEKPAATEVPVKVATATRMTLRDWVEGQGFVEPEGAGQGRPAASALLAAPVAGTVARVNCEPGAVVEAGALVLQLDDRLARAAEEQALAVQRSAEASLAKLRSPPRPEQVDVAQLAVDKAREGVDYANRAYERQKLLATQDGVSVKNLEAAGRDLDVAKNDLKTAERQLALLKAAPAPADVAEATGKVNEAAKAVATAQVQRSLLGIRSPLRATVVRVMAAPGEAADPTKPLVELVAMDRLVVNVPIPAAQASELRAGQAAEIVTDSAGHDAPPAPPATKPAESPASRTAPPPGKGDDAPSTRPAPALRGKVVMIGYQVDRKNGSVPVSISLPPDAGFRPGQFVSVRILVEEHADALAVPAKSVVHAEGEEGASVSVVHGDKAARLAVKEGLREGDWEEVSAEGLRAGESVVTEGAYGLPKETRIRVLGP